MEIQIYDTLEMVLHIFVVVVVVYIFGSSLEKHALLFLSSLFLGQALAALVTCIFYFSGNTRARIPITRPPAWHTEPPGPAGRQQAHVLGSRLLPSWTGAGRLGEGHWALIALAWTAARGTPRPKELLQKLVGGHDVTLALASDCHA